MLPDLRMQLQIARTAQFGDIIRTTFFGLIAIAAVTAFGGDGADIPLAVLTVALSVFGIIGGGVALDDVSALRDDMDDATGLSTYGQAAKSRNLGALKLLSAVLIGAAGLAELAAIFLL
ncbi:MAG: hypothetical protein AAGO57_04390 [Pseudomonadota bacterium]